MPYALHNPPAAAIFDMDGVVTNTAAVHATAWKELFDAALSTHAPDNEPFDADADYREYVDGKAREDGVRSFLASRDISLSDEEITSLAEQKQQYFEQALDDNGVEVFEDTITLITRLREEGTPVALVTSSRNAVPVLEKADLTELFDVRVDGNTVREEGLAGKPAPDMFVNAAEKLGVAPEECVVFEDARSGVSAAFAARYGLIIGVLRGDDDGKDLYNAGADRLLRDLSTVDLRLGWAVKGDVASASTYAVDYYDPSEVPSREALFGTGNGYWGTRGSLPGSVDDGTHYPGTYLAGVYNRVTTDLRDTAGVIAESEHVVNMPDWTHLRITTDDGYNILDPTCERLDYRQELDMDTGQARRIVVTKTGERITTVVITQLHSMADAHKAALRVEVIPENWEGEVEILSTINTDVRNRNVADDHALTNRHLSEPEVHHVDATTMLAEVTTTQSRVQVAIATRTLVGDIVLGTPTDKGLRFSTSIVRGRPLRIDKLAIASTSRDPALSTPRLDVLARLQNLRGFDALADASAAVWEKNWVSFRVSLHAGRYNQMALTFNTFHVLQNTALATRDLDAGTPARGLYGEGYRGHIFWDEIFVYPFLTLRQPALTRALLMYRYRRLDTARQAARNEGLRGARFPWQSGSDGSEETPSQLFNPINETWMPDNSHNQYHVGLDIAWCVWQYFVVTEDYAFLTDVGAELLIEIARLFASKADYDPDEDRYSISGVMGPDEFHDGYPDAPGQGLRDNAYTNVLASWTLARADEALTRLDPHVADSLRTLLDLTDEELRTWDHISRRLRLTFHEDGVLNQFDGYEHLKELDWEHYRATYDNIGRMDLILNAEGDSTNNYKLSKQADTLMLYHLFSEDELGAQLAHMGYQMSRADHTHTIRYYEARTTHGSTLSELVQAWAFSRSDLEESWTIYEKALGADLVNEHGSSTAEGIHLGVMAGTVDLLQRAYSGLEVRGDDLVLNPNLPHKVEKLVFDVHFRDLPVSVEIQQDKVTLHLHERAEGYLNVVVRGVHRRLTPGDTWVAALPFRE